MSRWFFDTEFIERGREFPLTLISIGLVGEDGLEFYGESSEFNADDCNPWVRENVLPHLTGYSSSVATIASCIRQVVGEHPEFWGYYADYDWVILCQMFGTMMDLPHGWPMWCRDLKQLCADRGDPDLRTLVPPPNSEHDAMADARWNKSVYDALTAPPASPSGTRGVSDG